MSSQAKTYNPNNLTLAERKDLIRGIGEVLYEEYRRGAIRTVLPYDTSIMTPDTDLMKFINDVFLDPARPTDDTLSTEELEAANAELQRIVRIVERSVRKYIDIKEQNAQEYANFYSLSVGKALAKDKGTEAG